MSTAPPVRPAVDDVRFRDALRGLPGRVWIISVGILVNRVGAFLPVFIVLYLTERGYSAGQATQRVAEPYVVDAGPYRGCGAHATASVRTWIAAASRLPLAIASVAVAPRAMT